MLRALIVEDDHDLAEIAGMRLSYAGYAVETAYTCAQALEILARDTFDLLLLDMLLPDSRGDALCQTIRSSCDCPIVFMSCLDDSTTIIDALRSGGDYYMVKPIDYDELLARTEAIVSRGTSRRQQGEGLRALRSFQIDTVRHRLLKGGEVIALSSVEYSLLVYMADHPNTLLLYHDLYRNVWENDSLGDVRTVMVHISNLRKKIDPDRRGIIETVRGAGYIFSDI